jgi:maltose alpha-D-glucosyltransferase/alpha-amylase
LSDRKQHSLWYKDAIIYELHVKAFYDSSGDGLGDFRGLMERLDYVQSLGVTAIWLLPFYPSPLRDDGYDIADYRGVHPDYGTLRDFRGFVREAHRRGLRVITELVVNHTSDQHPWFQAARRAKAGSARRNWYVWSNEDTKYAGTRVIFTDTERSNWAWDPVAGAYYWHRFFSHQPDLNHDNPQVVRAVGRALRFWLEMGVDGLRLDAVPYLCEREGTNCENLPETHAVIKQLRRLVDEHYDERMLLAEANQWPEDVRHYFGDSDECHMAFHFPLMPRIFMALRREDRTPIVEILNNTPDIPEACQWALFLRNHDELTLEMVTDEERDYMYSEYARDPRMRVNVGIRRRLAPLVDNDRRRIELLNSLLFSFPGSPVLYYGDEIGMGDNIYLGDRDGVRTPMQWTADRNGGFSRADPARLYLPPIMDPVYGYQAVNVESQQRNPSSLLHFMRRMISLRRQHRAFGRGSLEFLHPRNRKVLVYLRRYRDEVILAVANLSNSVQPCELSLREFAGWRPLEMMGHTEFPRIGELPYFLTLGPYAFYWFQLEPQAEPIRLEASGSEDLSALPWLTLEEGYDRLLAPEFHYTLAHDIIAPFLKRQRWFQGKARELVSAQLADWCKLGGSFYLILVDAQYGDGVSETYVVPLKLSEGAEAVRVAEEAPVSILARVRTPEDEGVLYDALADRRSCTALLRAMTDGRRFRTASGDVLAAGSSPYLLRPDRTDVGGPVRRLSAEQTNTSVVLNESYILKLFRRVQDGPNPELEILRHLGQGRRFKNIAPVAGWVELSRSDGKTVELALLQPFIANQGDGWDHLRASLRHLLAGRAELEWDDESRRVPATASLLELSDQSAPAGLVASAGESLAAARTLGRRTAELHLALSGERRDPAFNPLPMNASSLQSLADSLTRQAQEAIDLLGSRVPFLDVAVSGKANELLSAAPALMLRFQGIARLPAGTTRIRCHGDLHLGQVLVVGDDFLFIDFEGEPLRTLGERREKASPLRDVAGMLRSFHYVARSVLREQTGRGQQVSGSAERLAETWQTWMGAAYLGGYLEAAAGAAFLPARRGDLQKLLDAFILEKAFYELRYELNNRPEWVAIPIDAILSTGCGRAEPAD